MTTATKAKPDLSEIIAKINDHLESGKRVAIGPKGRSITYSPKHAGWFSFHNGSAYVRRGKSVDCIGTEGFGLMVAVRFEA